MRRVQCFILTILLLILLPFVAHVKGAEPEYTYGENDEKGPNNWGKLKPEWEKCGNGRFQSPIDINLLKVTITPSLGPLKTTYKPAPASLVNRGHDIAVEWEGDAGGIVINGTNYALQQCHWHTPSEHTIDHKRFEMEIHIVHTNSLGQIAVIGIPYIHGTPDPFIAKIIDNIRMLNRTDAILELGEINPRDIKFGSKKYFRYIGSLTTPPCTEGVLWTIIHKVRTASKEQIAALKDAVEDGFEKNARPVQKLFGRSVHLYHP